MEIPPAAIAKVCTEMNIPLVHISSDYVFGGSGVEPWKPSDITAPKNAYGRSKLVGEEGIKCSGATHAILRTSWVVSAHGTNFVKTMLQLSKTKDTLRIIADQIGGPTPARDIANVCMMIAQNLRQDPSKSGTYHYSGKPDVSWAEFASEIFKQAARPVTVIPIQTAKYPTPSKRPLNSRMDCSITTDMFRIEQPDWRLGLGVILKELGGYEIMKRKGIILAGGSGTRLYPLTIASSKQLLPIYDKPMIYYPLTVLMLAGLQDILIITTPEDQEQFRRLLGDGKQWGINLHYKIQPKPEGLAQAFILAEDLAGAPSAMVLGDNIFFGHGLPKVLAAANTHISGATLFGYHVSDPERYGVVDFEVDGSKSYYRKTRSPTNQLCNHRTILS